jgi:hypothetical protein
MLPSELKATLSHRTTFKPRAFSTAWALQAASLIDTHCPSLLNHILTASDCKRQVIFATFANFGKPPVRTAGQIGLVFRGRFHRRAVSWMARSVSAKSTAFGSKLSPCHSIISAWRL